MSESNARLHRKKDAQRQAKAAAARELRQQQRENRRQDIAAADAEEAAEIARAEAEADQYPVEEFDLDSGGGDSPYAETVDSHPSDSAGSDEQPLSSAASPSPPASEPSRQYKTLHKGIDCDVLLESLADKPYLA